MGAQAHLLVDARITGLLRPRATVLLETAKFIVETRKANRQAGAACTPRALSAHAWRSHTRRSQTAPSARASQEGTC
eukprot:5687717-Pleurochrysis_carterae.AAC.1